MRAAAKKEKGALRDVIGTQEYARKLGQVVPRNAKEKAYREKEREKGRGRGREASDEGEEQNL